MPDPPPDPAVLLRSRSYVGLLALAAILGVPISAAAYGFLALLTRLQEWVFADLPKAFGFQGTPLWWPLPPLALAGLLVGLTIRYLPGKGGHSPADGLAMGAPSPIELPGVVLAALASLSLGVVLGPEAPLIALGGGLAICAVRLARRDAPPRATTVVAAAGSFASISTLLGSPLLGAFLLMEASGLGGPMLGLVLVPGLVAAGIGSLIFIGLDAWTGLGTFSLALPDLPPSPSRTWPSSAGPWSSAWWPPCSGPGSDGSPWRSGLMSNGGWSWPPRWWAWSSPDWRSPMPRSAATASPTCCSQARTRWARSSARAQATRQERWCCWSSARGWPTAGR
jgi:hypothetical protein